MSIDSNDFEYVYHNYNDLINKISVVPKEKRTEREDKLFKDALLMEKLIFDSRHGG